MPFAKVLSLAQEREPQNVGGGDLVQQPVISHEQLANSPWIV
jgi:hypothetical protein